MATAGLPGRLSWHVGIALEIVSETPRAKSIVLELADWPGHQPGQHVDVRFLAPNGHQLQRTYWIASAPEDGYVVLTIERRGDGEASSYLCDQLAPGDQLELRGPMGDSFVWDLCEGQPVLLLAGGCGIVPFRSMLRHCVATESRVALRLFGSSRSFTDILYRDELLHLAAYDEVDIRFTLTREWPEGWGGHHGRIDRQMLDEVSWPPDAQPLIYICGPIGFVETAANALIESGHHSGQIKTEQYGPTGR
jgi:ferredoxin-NADP reductase